MVIIIIIIMIPIIIIVSWSLAPQLRVDRNAPYT